MMTGTKEDGTKDADTCKDWTVGNGDAKAMLGHADRLGRTAGVNSWNAVHASQGCGMEQLQPTGSTGLFYCFAINSGAEKCFGAFLLPTGEGGTSRNGGPG
jgi:hypothetical protein